MTHARSSLVFALLPLLALAGCPEKKADEKASGAESEKKDKKDQKKGNDDDGEDKAKKSSKKKGDDDGDDKGKKPKKGDDGDGDGDDDKAIAKPKKIEEPKDDTVIERTKVPSVAEWNASPEAKSTNNDCKCEVKTLREWLRVSCRKPSPTGGEPTAVQVNRGKNKETFLYSAKGVASMVTPLLPGTDMDVRFSWSDVVYKADVVWRKGKPKPAVVVDFDKTDDKPTDLQGTATCECFKKHYKAAKCGDETEQWKGISTNPWCEKTYHEDCEKMMECANGEPGVWPKCPKGFTNTGMGHYCVKTCSGSEKCGANEACVDGELAAQGKKVCEEKPE